MRHETELRKYQQRIATHLYEHDEALCVVRPGGGKTIAALTAVKELERDGVIRGALVIAPKRVATVVWPQEIIEWEHMHKGLPFIVVEGPREGRTSMLRALGTAFPHIVIVGLDNVGWLIEQLETFPADHWIFDLLIIDEISKLREPTGVRAKLLAKHASRWKMIWGLSGTLRPNSALDLFMPARIVMRGKLWGRSYYQWRQKWFRPTDFKGYNWAPVLDAEDQLNEELAPHCVTLRPEEYPQIPELSVILDYVTLPDKAKVQYRDMHRKLFADVGKNGKVLAVNTAVASGKLAQIANGFVYSDDDDGPTHVLHDEKREWLADIVEQATGPMIIVYQFLQDLEMIREVTGRSVPYLGAGVGDNEAATTIRQWNAGKLPFMALHPAAGGHGLNLQKGGCDMAWIAPTWSPEQWEQTIARIHRPGQTRPVMVRVCVAVGTVDEMKLNRVQFKLTEQQAFEGYLAQFEETMS